MHDCFQFGCPEDMYNSQLMPSAQPLLTLFLIFPSCDNSPAGMYSEAGAPACTPCPSNLVASVTGMGKHGKGRAQPVAELRQDRGRLRGDACRVVLHGHHRASHPRNRIKIHVAALQAHATLAHWAAWQSLKMTASHPCLRERRLVHPGELNAVCW